MKKRTKETLTLALFLCALSLPNFAHAQWLLMTLSPGCAPDGYDIDLDAFMDLPESIRNATTTENDDVFFEKVAVDETSVKDDKDTEKDEEYSTKVEEEYDAVRINNAFVEAEIADDAKTYRYDSAVGVFWGCADRQLKTWMEELGAEYIAWDPSWDVGNERSYNHYFAFMAPENGIIEKDEVNHFVRSEEAVSAGYNAGFSYGYQCDALLEVTLDETCNNLFANGLSYEACDRYVEGGDTGSLEDTGADDTGGADSATAAKVAKNANPKTINGSKLEACSTANTARSCKVTSKKGVSQVRVR
jgi:hypothetical protein